MLHVCGRSCLAYSLAGILLVGIILIWVGRGVYLLSGVIRLFCVCVLGGGEEVLRFCWGSTRSSVDYYNQVYCM